MIMVIKINGELEPFSEEKVLASLKRIGIADSQKMQVLQHVKSNLHENIKTSEIYNNIIEFLDKTNPYAKAKFNLKRSIMDLGPTGYPFEDFIASILKSRGYQTATRQILKGACISHEIDVIAQKSGRRTMIEAKFHNVIGIKTNVHVALYTKARFEDIKNLNKLDEAWLVTNTKATADAISYADCVGMKIISWNYPAENSLKDMIEESKLIPVTALTMLSQAQKQQLIAHNFVHCQDICRDHSFLNTLNLSNEQKEEVLKEAQFVCSA